MPSDAISRREYYRAAMARWRAAHPGKAAEAAAAYRAANPEKAKASKAKWRAANKAAERAAQAVYRAANAAKIKAGMAKWRAENSDKIKAAQAKWREENREHIAAVEAAWYAANSDRKKAYRDAKRDVYAAHASKRRAATLEACPSWLTDEAHRAIREAYAEAKHLTKATGVVHHVDHIVPLQGRGVCGLHVPWNLQTLPAADNLRKSNHLPSAFVDGARP